MGNFSTSTSDRLKRISRQSFGVRNRSTWRRMLSDALHHFHENDLFTSAAAMSYFGLMTLFPALLLLLALSNRMAAGTQMIARIVQIYPGSGKFLSETIQSLSGISSGAIFTCALTLAMIGLVGLLLSLSVLLTSVLVGLQEIAGRLSPRQLENYRLLATVGSVFWQVVFALGSLLVTFTLFSVVYKFMPNAYVTVRDTIPGAVIGGLLWEASKYGFAWSVNYFHYDQIYGSVGAVVAVLTWGYVSSLVLLFGAQLTGVFHREHFEIPAIAPNTRVPSYS
jgi:membrane protein